MTPDTIVTILTGIGVIFDVVFGVWRLQADIARAIEGVRRDLTSQISSVNYLNRQRAHGRPPPRLTRPSDDLYRITVTSLAVSRPSLFRS